MISSKLPKRIWFTFVLPPCVIFAVLYQIWYIGELDNEPLNPFSREFYNE